MKIKDAAGDALRQAFMPKEEYDNLRVEERAWNRLARPLLMTAVSAVWGAVVLAFFLMTHIVFAVAGDGSAFCQRKRVGRLDVVGPVDGDSRASYLLTEEEAARYFWIVVFLPTAIVSAISVVYLMAGIAVAYSAPERHACLRVVENSCCASRRGGVRCLAVLNISFSAVFVLLALFLGSTILALETDCSIALFWCYEVVCWGTALLLAGAAFFLLRRKAAVIMDAGSHYGSRTIGVELLEAPPVEPDYVIEQRIADGFKSWSGALDSDDEEEFVQQSRPGLDDVWEDDESEETYASVVDIMKK